MCPHQRAHWRHLENTIERPSTGAMRPYVKYYDHLLLLSRLLLNYESERKPPKTQSMTFREDYF